MPRRCRSGSIARSAPSEMRAHIAELAPRRRHADLRLSQCRACPTNSAATTRAPRSHGGAARRIRRGRPRQHRRRLLRHHAGAYPRHCRARLPARRRDAIPAIAPRLAAVRPRSLHADAGDSVRECRRAHQRHRLGKIPQARSPPAITRPRSRSRAIRSRTARRSSTSTWTRGCSIPRRR